MSAETFYICTAIAYVNGIPHIGHAMEMIQADCMARYQRQQGKDTHFLTGTDEFGSKIYQKAQELGLETADLVSQNAEVFKKLTKKLNLTNDDFIQTNSPRHIASVEQIWRKLQESGDIYKDQYEGLYCVGCEGYVTESDLDENGNCPNHLKPPEKITEENYFFQLSKYSEKIGELIRTDELKIIPESRKNEILSLIDSDTGLQDISFSRPKSALPWGVTVPDDPEQVMYVWCDALSNYVSALGYGTDKDELFQKYWPANIQLIGKDILRFHAGIWIGMLLSIGAEIPKQLSVHGFITSEGQKMSKSLGNVVDPFALVEKYGSDAVRYYLLKEIPTTNDGDFTYERFEDTYNSDLANNVGNLASRVTTLLTKYNDGQVTVDELPVELADQTEALKESYHQYFSDYDLKKAAEAALKLAQLTNQYLEQEQPWQIAKDDQDAAITVLSNTVLMLRELTEMLKPYIPEAMAKLDSAVNSEKVTKPGILFPRLEN